MLVFTGQFEYTIDEKGRLSIPSRLRDQVERDGQAPSLFVVPGPKGQLMAYPEKQFNELADIYGSREDTAEALRFMMRNSEECPIDKQGRVVLSPRLRDEAGISRDVTILGVGKRIEFWDKARAAKYSQDGAARIQGALGQLKGRADLWG